MTPPDPWSSLIVARRCDRGGELPDPARHEQVTIPISIKRTDVARRAADAAGGRGLSVSARRPTTAPVDEDGALRRGSLRFMDEGLEREYQRQGGAEGLAGFRITTGTAAALWLLAALVVPNGTPIPLDRAIAVCSAMALLNVAAFLRSSKADTLDRQHGIVSLLTSANGLVILWLAATGGVLPGYGVSAVMLLFAFGAVARTGFVFAAYRSAVIVVGFAVAAILYPDPGELLVDAFIFGAAVGGSLVALRLLERSRRRVFYQDIVISRQADALRIEKDRVDALLLNVLPGSISARLLAGEHTIADEYPAVSVLFADIVGFTPMAARLPAEQVVGMLDRLFARFDELVAERGLEKIKTIGDAYMAAGGVPDRLDDHAARIVDLGLAMIEAARQVGGTIADLELRVGVHSGPVIGGVIGDRKLAFDIWGETVNIASRLESTGIPGRVQVSPLTLTNVEHVFDAEPRGPVDLPGHGPMATHLIVGRRSDRSAGSRGVRADIVRGGLERVAAA
jgi:adenylate cyclase